MNFRKQSNKWLVILVAPAVVMLIIVLALAYLAYAPGSVITETERNIPNLAGKDFEITYTNVDLIAKEEYISVYASPAAAKGRPLFAKLHKQKTLLFRYDPGRWDNPSPSIVATGPNSILISVPEVSSVTRQNKDADGLHVDYDIGHIDYP